MLSSKDAYRFQKSYEGKHRVTKIPCPMVMPIGVFVDLFARAANRVKTRTLFSFRNVQEEVLQDLMDPGWNQTVTVADDAIRCTASLPSIVFRYWYISLSIVLFVSTSLFYLQVLVESHVIVRVKRFVQL